MHACSEASNRWCGHNYPLTRPQSVLQARGTLLHVRLLWLLLPITSFTLQPLDGVGWGHPSLLGGALE
jgi:hypothetical protein